MDSWIEATDSGLLHWIQGVSMCNTTGTYRGITFGRYWRQYNGPELVLINRGWGLPKRGSLKGLLSLINALTSEEADIRHKILMVLLPGTFYSHGRWQPQRQAEKQEMIPKCGLLQWWCYDWELANYPQLSIVHYRIILATQWDSCWMQRTSQNLLRVCVILRPQVKQRPRLRKPPCGSAMGNASAALDTSLLRCERN